MENTNLDAVSCDYCEYGDINEEIKCSLRDIAPELEGCMGHGKLDGEKRYIALGVKNVYAIAYKKEKRVYINKDYDETYKNKTIVYK